METEHTDRLNSGFKDTLHTRQGGIRMNLQDCQKRLIAAAVSFTLLGCGSAAETAKSDTGYDGGLRIENGMAMPMVKFSDAKTDNRESDIMRFCVYVETDNDTDGDGKADLVKAFIQVPKSALEGTYKAAAIYDPTPYSTGTIDNTHEAWDVPYETAEFDKSKLYAAGAKRESAGSIDALTAALEADSSQWLYAPPKTTYPGYYHTGMYDYYLIRGFAVVMCCGIGTYGSEGFELCGYDLERDSHKAVVEWLAGNRRAFTDKENNIEVAADWCNHNVAMTGVSYGGTLPYEVATTGVEGLKTIIPVAGISNWYNYTNSQGVSISAYPHYQDYLSAFNAGNLFFDDEWLVPNPDYIAWLRKERADEEKANGNYDETWAAYNYADDYESIRCSAMIIEGLNDFNVMSTHAVQMYEAFKKAGQNVKVLFHQDGHNSYLGKYYGDQLSDEVYNKWLCHYLYDVDNGIETMPEITVQSNLDGSFITHDSWNDLPLTGFKPEETGETVIHSGVFTDFAEQIKEKSIESIIRSFDSDHLKIYDLPIPAGSTISGTPEVHVRLSTEDVDQDNLMVSAVLFDTADDGSYFKAFELLSGDRARLPHKTIGTYEYGEGHAKGKILEYVQSYTDAKLVSVGWIDLLDPEAKKDPTLDTNWHTAAAGKYADYSIVLTPTEYTIAEGHHLQLYLFAQDPLRSRSDDSVPGYFTPDKTDEVYSFKIDNTSVEAAVPLR